MLDMGCHANGLKSNKTRSGVEGGERREHFTIVVGISRLLCETFRFRVDGRANKNERAGE